MSYRELREKQERIKRRKKKQEVVRKEPSRATTLAFLHFEFFILVGIFLEIR